MLTIPVLGLSIPINALTVGLALLAVLLLGVLVHDLTQRGSAILRNFPLIGHIRYLLIEIGPEIRQYLVAGNREESPFNRSEREWIYASADRKNNYFGFGTDDQLYGAGYPVIKHAVVPHGEESFTGSKHDKNVQIPCAKVIGQLHRRPRAWRPPSIVNISAMSYGSLGKNAVSALNLGAKLAGCFHNVARETMLSIGCIQAQKCHTGNCPAGVATQRWWLERGMVPEVGAKRAQGYLESFRNEPPRHKVPDGARAQRVIAVTAAATNQAVLPVLGSSGPASEPASETPPAPPPDRR